MKRNPLLIALISLSTIVFGQNNTFPTPSGNVGIGTTSPAEKLHVYRNASGVYTPLVIIEDDITNGYTQLALKGTGRQYHIGVGNGSETGFSLANKFYIFDQNAVLPRFTIDASGNIGIGITSPSAQFHTTGSVRFAGLSNNNALTRIMVTDANGNVSYRDASTISGTSGWAYDGNTVAAIKKFGTIDNYEIPFITNNIERLRIGTNGSVGIGTTNISDTSFKLYVESGIRTRRVKVDMLAWADYVFNPGYKLLSLSEVEDYIKHYSHLPNVPSTCEIQEQGLDLGDGQAMLLRKIEELTLYLIELKKANDDLSAKIEKIATTR